MKYVFAVLALVGGIAFCTSLGVGAILQCMRITLDDGDDE